MEFTLLNLKHKQEPLNAFFLAVIVIAPRPKALGVLNHDVHSQSI